MMASRLLVLPLFSPSPRISPPSYCVVVVSLPTSFFFFSVCQFTRQLPYLSILSPVLPLVIATPKGFPSGVNCPLLSPSALFFFPALARGWLASSKGKGRHISRFSSHHLGIFIFFVS